MEEFKEVSLAPDQAFYNDLIKGFGMILRATKVTKAQAFTMYFNAAMSMVPDTGIDEATLVRIVKESFEHFKSQKEVKQ